MNKKNTPVVNIGSSSMLVIFLILCLVTFSILSLSSANSDYNFSKRIAERTDAYYKANNQAEAVVTAIDRLCANSYDNESTDFNAYLNNIGNQIEELDVNDGSISHNLSEETPTVNIQIPINQKQALSVIIRINNPKKDHTFYTLVQWKEITTQEWNGDNTLNLLDISNKKEK